jgi:Cu(I)/Ag(I) efflux system membrane fusion protein/cobalt-zinc-cadmium efflux system membrane fusion protein
MNKYVFRTSLVWIAILAVFAGAWAYHSRSIKPSTPMKIPVSGDVQPVASGPPPGTNESAPSTPEQKMETPLVPVQLTPERMQSIGVRTGTVEYKLLSDDIRATGTVDINERLLSYVQVRFPGYIRKVLPMQPINTCARETHFSRSTAQTSWQPSRSICWHGRTRKH